MPIKGHPLPTGEACQNISTLSHDEREKILTELETHKTEKSRSRKEDERSKKSIDQIKSERAAAKLGMKSPATKEANKLRMKSPANKEAAKLRMKSPANKEADKLRKRSPANKEASRLRMKKAALLRKKRRLQTNSYTGWCDPKLDSKPYTEALVVPKMDEVCVDCGALMFPFETKREKGIGFSFSLCCDYGK